MPFKKVHENKCLKQLSKTSSRVGIILKTYGNQWNAYLQFTKTNPQQNEYKEKLKRTVPLFSQPPFFCQGICITTIKYELCSRQSSSVYWGMEELHIAWLSVWKLWSWKLERAVTWCSQMGDPEKAYLLAFIGYVKGLTSSLPLGWWLIMHINALAKMHTGAVQHFKYAEKFSQKSVFS